MTMPPASSNIRPIGLETEMRTSYLDYAMSVIISRALPDVRDGLKPVQRRIVWGMFDGGARAGAGYRKSAGIVGDVMGRYHPHGDGPVYEAMVRMAQEFSMRYPLVDGQGNFGSVDGDPPAAHDPLADAVSRLPARRHGRLHGAPLQATVMPLQAL